MFYIVALKWAIYKGQCSRISLELKLGDKLNHLNKPLNHTKIEFRVCYKNKVRRIKRKGKTLLTN